LVVIAAGGVVLLLGVLVFALNMRRGLNHDEHQFIAGGALMAQGLLPYRDFVWFHLPGQGWVNALLFRSFDHLLLTARMVSIVAATGTLALLMCVALCRITYWRPWTRLGVASLILLLLVSAPGYWFAAGRAWNHDLAVLLALAAFCLHALGLERLKQEKGRGTLLVLAAGIALGSAISVRLTLAPLVLPFLIAPLLWRLRGRQLWLSLLVFVGGMGAGMIPTFVAFVSSPGGFLLGNLRYAALNTLWYAEQGADTTFAAKLHAIGTQLAQPGNFLLLVLAGVALWRARRAIATNEAPEVRFWLVTAPFVLGGAVAPTPMQVQYLFALFPFAALGMMLALRYVPPVRWFTIALGASAVVAAVLAAPRYLEGIEVLPTPSAWYPVRIHARGEYLAGMMAAQMKPATDEWIFTLSPILPLEGDVPIDVRTATGPFAWRIAGLLAPTERAEYGILGAEDFEGAMAASPPRALLTAMHSDDESADDATLEGWALAHEYVALPMPDEGTLWLSPLAEWGSIRLGAQTFPILTTPGGTAQGTLYLQSSAPTETNLNLLLRAVDVASNELFRFDGWPYGSATSTWETEALWQDGHTFAIPLDAAPGNYRLEASFYDPTTFETLGDVAVIGWITVAENQEEGASIADFKAITLLNAAPQEDTARPGEEIAIELVWQTNTPLSTDYTRFAHLVDESGTLVAQSDAQPQGGFYPTSQWGIGIPVRDVVTLRVPDDVAAGAYTLHIGLYDAASGERLPETQGGDSYRIPVRVNDGGTQP